jgi:hypothetical protein
LQQFDDIVFVLASLDSIHYPCCFGEFRIHPYNMPSNALDYDLGSLSIPYIHTNKAYCKGNTQVYSLVSWASIVLLLSLPSGVHMPVNSTLPMVGYYDSGDPHNVDIDIFNCCILHILLVVLLFLLFYPGGGYTDQIF